MKKFFRFKQLGTNYRNELVGGLTTFVTMAYIIVVNPAILSAAGIPIEPSTIATILVAGIGTILMGLVANRPIGVAPYMGENAFIAYGLISMGIGWQLRLGAVFVSGLIFLVITLLKIRGWLANSISPSMKYSFAVGIGLFLSFIGLNETGLVKSWVVGKPPIALFPEFLGTPCDCITPIPAAGVSVPVEIGHLASPAVLLSIASILLITILMVLKVRGAILLGVVATGAAGIALGLGKAPEGIVALPQFTGENGLFAIAGQLRLSETITNADGTTRTISLFSMTMLPVLLTLFLMDFLDSIGTLMGVGAAGEMLDENGDFPQVERPLLVDSSTSVISALLGTSTSGAYIESATGIKDGARSGLAAIVTGVLFLLSLFFIPLITPLAGMQFAYGPALVVVGILMIKSITRINFEDMTELVPAFVTIVMMVFTYNIANGLTAGLAIYPIIKICTGRWRDLNAGMIVLGAMCLMYFLFGMVH
ncbi:MAG: NCS2 family permease [Candidatus Alcyoniella australis]|nr:NCS2 family permease [Candidatus Alcyoniella australis]